MTDAKTLSLLAKKIIKARKIQKDRIDQDSDAQFYEAEAINKFQQPIVREIDKQNESLKALEVSQKQQVLALDTLKQIPTQLRAIQSTAQRRLRERPIIQMQKRQKVLSHPKQLDHSEVPTRSLSPYEQNMNKVKEMQQALKEIEEEEQFKTPEKTHPLGNNWVQNFYKKYRDHTANKTTSLEINTRTNQLGDNGIVDFPKLLNDNVLNIDVKGKKVNIPEKSLTPGLLGLLMLHSNEMEADNIKPSPDDVSVYHSILDKVGFTQTSKNNLKYKKYIKPYLAPEKKTGQGLFMYKDSNDLTEKLNLLVGSFRAGNNNPKVKSEIRMIVDKLYELGDLPFSLHKKFFIKYNL